MLLTVKNREGLSKRNLEKSEEGLEARFRTRGNLYVYGKGGGKESSEGG